MTTTQAEATMAETEPQLLQRLGDDAAKWASEFRQTAIKLGYSDMDEGWLIGWFANAIENAEITRRERCAALSRGAPTEQEVMPHRPAEHQHNAQPQPPVANDTAGARSCTCHPDDNPPRPCPQKFALSECREAAKSSPAPAAEPMRERRALALDAVEHILKMKRDGYDDDNCLSEGADVFLEVIETLEPCAPIPAAEVTGERWWLGSMNDGLFIINRPPRPSTDDCYHDRPDGPDMVIAVSALSPSKAQQIVDAHNDALAAPSPDAGRVPEMTEERARLLLGALVPYVEDWQVRQFIRDFTVTPARDEVKS